MYKKNLLSEDKRMNFEDEQLLLHLIQDWMEEFEDFLSPEELDKVDQVRQLIEETE